MSNYKKNLHQRLFTCFFNFGTCFFYFFFSLLLLFFSVKNIFFSVKNIFFSFKNIFFSVKTFFFPFNNPILQYFHLGWVQKTKNRKPKKKSYINTKKNMASSRFEPLPCRLELAPASQLDCRLYVVMIVPVIYL